MTLVYFPNNVAAIMVAYCVEKTMYLDSRVRGPSLEEHNNIYVVTGYNQLHSNFVP